MPLALHIAFWVVLLFWASIIMLCNFEAGMFAEEPLNMRVMRFLISGTLLSFILWITYKANHP